MYIGNGIRNARQEAGLSQREAAERLQMPRTYLSFIENGHALASWDMVQRMAELFRCTVGDLYKPGLLDVIRQSSIGEEGTHG